MISFCENITLCIISLDLIQMLMNARKKVLVSVMTAVVRTLGVVMIVSAKEVFYI